MVFASDEVGGKLLVERSDDSKVLSDNRVPTASDLVAVRG